METSKECIRKLFEKLTTEKLQKKEFGKYRKRTMSRNYFRNQTKRKKDRNETKRNGITKRNEMIEGKKARKKERNETK
jgi:hypothetical protein